MTLLDAMAGPLGLADDITDDAALGKAVARFREQGIVLPTFAELADPSTIDPARTAGVDPAAPDAANLFRVHWYNDLAGARVGRARARRAADRAHRRRQPDHRGVRRPLPDDRRPQGAGRLRLPRAPGRHRPVRPDPPPRHLAVAPATTPAAASPSAGSWAAAASPCCPRA